MILPNRAPSRLLPPDLPLPAGIGPGLTRARAHEIYGPARVALALLVMAQCDGPVIWIMPSWLAERPHACGIAGYTHPGRLIFAQARRPEDLQWAAEEALRSGAAPVVLVEMPKPPGLTPVRRLHLAAEAGAETAHHAGLGPAPLALILCPGEGGAQGVESRWHICPSPALSSLTDDAGPAWHLERRRDRRAPVAAWSLTRSPEGRVSAEPA